MNRGDFVTIAVSGDFGEPRLALVIQPDQFSEHATVIVLPVSSTLVDAPLLRVTIIATRASCRIKPAWQLRTLRLPID